MQLPRYFYFSVNMAVFVRNEVHMLILSPYFMYVTALIPTNAPGRARNVWLILTVKFASSASQDSLIWSLEPTYRSV